MLVLALEPTRAPPVQSFLLSFLARSRRRAPLSLFSCCCSSRARASPRRGGARRARAAARPRVTLLERVRVVERAETRGAREVRACCSTRAWRALVPRHERRAHRRLCSTHRATPPVLTLFLFPRLRPQRTSSLARSARLGCPGSAQTGLLVSRRTALLRSDFLSLVAAQGATKKTDGKQQDPVRPLSVWCVASARAPALSLSRWHWRQAPLAVRVSLTHRDTRALLSIRQSAFGCANCSHFAITLCLRQCQ